VLRRRYGKEADIWSSGVILYILLCGVPPFWGETEQQIFDCILKGQLDFTPDPWPRISDEAKDCVKRMLIQARTLHYGRLFRCTATTTIVLLTLTTPRTASSACSSSRARCCY